MRPFIFDQPTYRVIFGAGSIETLPQEVTRLGGRRALVVSTRAELPFAEDAARRLGEAAAGMFNDAVMHHPIETVHAARARAKALNADCYVTIGGGTTTGTGKVIALETGMPVIAVPTTYAGSEMTPIYGITEGGVKKTGRDRIVIPRAVIIVMRRSAFRLMFCPSLARLRIARKSVSSRTISMSCARA